MYLRRPVLLCALWFSLAVILVTCAHPIAASAQATPASPTSEQNASGQASPGNTVAVPQTVDAETPTTAWNAKLGEIEARLNDNLSSRTEVNAIRVELEDMRQLVQAYINEQTPLLPQLEARFRSLGETPGKNDPPELKAVADQRLELRNSIATLKGTLQASNETLIRIEGLAERTRTLRRVLFEKHLLERSPSPFSPELWRYIGQDATIAWNRYNLTQSHLWDTLISDRAFISYILAGLVLAAMLTFVMRRQIDLQRRWTSQEPPSDWRRMETAGRIILMRLLPAAAGCSLVYLGLYQSGLLNPTGNRVVFAAITSIIIVAIVLAVIRTALAIKNPQWHLINLGPKTSRSLYYHLMALAALYGIDKFVSEIIQITAMPVSISIVQSVISSALAAGTVISILRIRQSGPADSEQREYKIGPAYIRIPLWIAALTVIVAAVTGYAALARFITGQLIVTSTILIVTYLLVFWANAFGQTITDEHSSLGSSLRQKFGLDQRRIEQFALPLTLILKALITIAAIPFILLLWGFDWFDIGNWLRQALFGFEIGGIRISVFSVMTALLLFLLAAAGARLFQAWLDRSVLERAGVEAGVRDSVRTGVGYLGIAIAALISVSYLGLDFSNLAIVAGALSVGIGFGLQSIVNNFVSGLILLAERPIKAGDWIIAGGYEGIVRKISVRSTEIETFDRANVVVPNSVLISESVKNWTLHNNTGRMPIPIGVHYDSDPEQVRDILLEAARQNPQVMSNPAPFVYFADFADNSLNFVLYVYLSNVNFSFSVRTNLRIEILKAFRENGVEIPYPQRDIHLSEVKWLKDALQSQPPRSSKNQSGRQKRNTRNGKPSFLASHSETGNSG